MGLDSGILTEGQSVDWLGTLQIAISRLMESGSIFTIEDLNALRGTCKAI